MWALRKGDQVFVSTEVGGGLVGRVARVEDGNVWVTVRWADGDTVQGPYPLSAVEPAARRVSAERKRVWLLVCDNGHIRRGSPNDPACTCTSSREVLFIEAPAARRRR